jgi:hypothetical protein
MIKNGHTLKHVVTIVDVIGHCFSSSDLSRTKNILFFTTYFHMKDFQFGFGQQPFVDNKCPVTNCFATNNRSLLGKL